MQSKTFSMELAGKTLTAEFTDLAEQASGSVILRYGETAILVTAVMGEREQAGLPYFPLSVEYEEKFYAAGAILGSRFQRREGRPSDGAVLSARIVDRTIRPLFEHHIRHEVQVVITVLAMGEDDPDVLGVIGASLALSVSDIPWNGPVGVVRIGQKASTGEILINPTYTEREEDKLNFEVLSCGKDGNINMIETGANEVSEDDIVAVLEASTKVHQKLEAWQKEIVAEVGKTKREIKPRELPDELHTIFENEFKTRLSETLFSGRSGKDHIHALKDEFLAALEAAEADINLMHAAEFYEAEVDKELHRGVIKDKKRADGRGMDEVRALHAKAGGISPVLHGSGIFYRGATHIFTALTLGGPEAAQLLDTIEERETKKRFMHHYNFPPFSVGETGRVGGFNRRMIGHGALAEKALEPVIPEKDAFPYTIRLVSETMSSNGSSSMGSVCASSLAMMDGGVPIKGPSLASPQE
ncbi:polyribonucleotide nucleotidyltransferase [Candidatus Kaiserbacteria bacterium]|nr:polyribonucleotide nucleotidyltransferase [Candidatus Kaiserbacteria bacterium]